MYGHALQATAHCRMSADVSAPLPDFFKSHLSHRSHLQALMPPFIINTNVNPIEEIDRQEEERKLNNVMLT